MATTTMSRLQVTFYRHRTRPGVIAVSPVSTNLVFPEPDDWELERQDIINTDRVEPGTEIAAWLEAFRRLGYCVLEPSGPGLERAKATPIPGLRKSGAETIASPPPWAVSSLP